MTHDTWPLWATSSDCCPVTAQVSAGNHIIRTAWEAHPSPQRVAADKRRDFVEQKWPSNNMLEPRIEPQGDTEAKEDKTSE